MSKSVDVGGMVELAVSGSCGRTDAGPGTISEVVLGG